MSEQPKSFVLVSEIVEANGKTVRENNMERGHSIPIGTLVEVKYDEWFGDGGCQKVHARLWVAKHTRDCDGTPLYVLTKHQAGMWEYLCSLGQTGHALAHATTAGPFSEDSLTVVPVTPELVYGTGALSWPRSPNE